MAAEGMGASGGDLRLPRYREHAFAIMALFLIWVVARYMQWGERLAVFSATRFEYSVGLLLAVLCIGLLVSRPPSLLAGKRLLIAIALLFAAMLVQLPFAFDPVVAQNTFIDRVLKSAFLTFFMMVLIRSPRYMTYFLYAFLFACLYITQESVRGLISGGLVWENQGVMRLHGAVPMYMHPNSLSGLAMGAVPFVVFLLPVWRQWWARVGLVVLLGTSLTCVLYSGSRTAYVGFLAFGLYWWMTSRRRLRWALIAGTIIAVGLPLLPKQYKERFESITGKEKEGASKEARIVILEDAWSVFLSNPGGIGVASFPAARMARFGRSQDTHNLYLEIATNLGVQGLAVFGFLIATLLKSFRTAKREFEAQRTRLRRWLALRNLPSGLRRAFVRHDRDLAFLVAVSDAAFGFIFVRLVLGLFGMDLYEVYWWFAAGLGITLLNMMARTCAITQRLEELGEADAGLPA